MISCAHTCANLWLQAALGVIAIVVNSDASTLQIMLQALMAISRLENLLSLFFRFQKIK